MCVVTRRPCGNPAATHAFAFPPGRSARRRTSRHCRLPPPTDGPARDPMPLPPPVTTAVLPANSVMCTSLAFRGRSRYGHRYLADGEAQREGNVKSASAIRPPARAARRIDRPCLGTSEISTGGGDGKLGWESLLSSMTPPALAFGLSRRAARPSRQKLGKLNPDRLPSRISFSKVFLPSSHRNSRTCCCNARYSPTRVQPRRCSCWLALTVE